MKLFAMLLVSFAAASAMACPNLDGTYQCEKDANDPSDSGVVTVQTAQNGTETIYVLTDKDAPDEQSYLPADGKLYQEGQNTYTGSCSGNKFVIVLTGVDADVGPYTVNQSFQLDGNQNLVNEGNISFKHQGQDQNYPFSSLCARL